MVWRTQSHAHRHIGVLHHLCEFLETDLAVMVEICFHDRLVDNLIPSSKSAIHPR
jgi:hypothetical protein